MIRLPVIQGLDVDGFAMYPGTRTSPGLHVTFQPGTTLVLGANGLGKTTLVNIIFRMLTGPADLPGLADGIALGSRRLESRRFKQPYERRIFSARVHDNAVNATATLLLSLGDASLSLTRDLSSLDLVEMTIDGQPAATTQEDFESLIIKQANLSSFADWIVILRLLHFYFEDRRALVWDYAAQRELLKLLFLPKNASREWTVKYREILEIDSLVRNLQYALNKEERLLGKQEKALGSAAEVRQQIELLSSIQDEEQTRLEELEAALAAAAEARQGARLAALTTEQERESAARSLERLQLRSIEAAFPSASVTARYIVGQLISDETCLTCGSHVHDFAEELRRRLKTRACPVCSTTLNGSHSDRPTSRKLAAASDELARLDDAVEMVRKTRVESEVAFDELLKVSEQLTRSIDLRRRQINELIKRLPPDEQQVHERRAGIASDRVRLDEYKSDLNALRSEFEKLQHQANQTISARSDEVKEAFNRFATDFLFEDCSLVWSMHRDRLGETGPLVNFPAFQVELTGADFPSPVRRSGPSQVSESQREFIDLAFKMALMSVASGDGSTLVIDAPESSLDAVFVSRAASVLVRFGESRQENRLVVTSNLIDGDLIPALLARTGIRSSRSRRVVDLLNIAAPTAATSRMHDEYVDVRRQLFARAQEVRNA